jgi:hypothetical protein
MRKLVKSLSNQLVKMAMQLSLMMAPSREPPTNNPTMKDLMKKVEKLKAENKMLKTKGKKSKSYSSNEDDNSEEEVFNKGRKGRRKYDKPSYNSLSFNYNNMSTSTALILPYLLTRLPVSIG